MGRSARRVRHFVTLCYLVGALRAPAAGHDLPVFLATDGSDGSARNGGLPWDPFKAIVAPRPIGWLSTVDPDGRVNLAPYSF